VKHEFEFIWRLPLDTLRKY